MAATATARSILRSSSFRSSAEKFVSNAKSFSSSLPKAEGRKSNILWIKHIYVGGMHEQSTIFKHRVPICNVGCGYPEAGRSKSSRSKKMGKSPFSTMSPLHFHYEDVLRQDLLLKLNCANIMQVPGLCEVRLMPKASASSGIATKSGKVATEILCGQRFLKAKKDPNAGRPNSFMGAEKDAGFARQSTLRGHEMSNFLVRVLSVMSMLDSRVEVRENTIKFPMGTEFCQSSPELEDHFEFFEHIQAFNVTISTTASTKEETSLLWSGLLLNDEVETK